MINSIKKHLHLIIPLFYFVGILILLLACVLPLKEFVSSMTVFVGWLVALLMLWIQLQKTKESSLQVKQTETKKSLQIEAFKEINNAISAFSDAITTVNTTIMMLPGNLELHREHPELFEFNPLERGFGIANDSLDFSRGHTQFIFSLESHEIAILEFKHLSSYI
jgi:hypothetical protein